MAKKIKYQKIRPDCSAHAWSPNKYLVRVKYTYYHPKTSKPYKFEEKDFIQWHNIYEDLKEFSTFKPRFQPAWQALGYATLSLVLGFFGKPAGHLFAAMGAIAFDTSGNNQSANTGFSGARTFTYVMSASSGGIITGGIMGSGGNSAGYLGGNMNYNSVNLTNVDTSNNGGNNSALQTYYLQSPATGSNTFSWSITPPNSSSDQCAIVMSFTGAATSGSPVDGHFIVGGTSSTTNTLANSGSMIVQWRQAGSNSSFSQGTTREGFQIANRGGWYAGNQYAPGTSGSISLGLSANANEWGGFGILPAPSGPANLKTVNGLAKASIKTVSDGLAIASWKTWVGLA